MQVSLYAKNPNRRIGIFYHTLAVHVAYRGQQISLPTALPPTYQPHDDFTVWSPYLHGSAVAWKVGTWMSGKYHMYVSCPAYYKFAGDDQNGSTAGGIVGPAAKLQVLQNCVVDV
ncbi:NDR1/HIN1-like protein 1 [Senna tora]|uniref:NDR1/HIN1-like protein 1 n=1 Tax=Senna tora TaxID=362788 RepID=A0A834TJ78_9FABA|nr:NDR1/HIN1-like protein 1 [Senna tora]